MTSPTALVTGASSGIGLQFCRVLAEQGYAVSCVARREDRLRTLVASLPGEGHDYLVADLAQPADVEQVAARFARDHVQLLINNAGFSALEPFADSPLALQEKILDVNCSALVALAHAFLQHARPGDAIINLASVVAYLPTPAQPMYSASKAFIASFSECLWEEQRHRGVYVMGLCPGMTESEFISTATGGESTGENLPSAVVQTAEAVVGEAMRALQKRKKAIVISGRVNRWMCQLPRFLTRHRLIRILAVMGDPERAL